MSSPRAASPLPLTTTGAGPHGVVTRGALTDAATHPEADDAGTRDRVRTLVVEHGPIDAAGIAAIVDLTPAGVRRHLTALVAAGEIAERPAVGNVPRGRGRPPREYVATAAAQLHLPDGSGALAAQALAHIAAHLGRDGVASFAQERLVEIERAYRPVVEAAGPDVAARAAALADAMSADGYAASTRSTSRGGLTLLQLCQGHCPVRTAAAEFPELCDAETRLIARLLGVHVQRLATIAAGGHACTTAIPVPTVATRAAPEAPTPDTSAPTTHSATPRPAQSRTSHHEEGTA
ncbi:helix-turn-helix transcriptional regulator [Miniimonas arenae]|uniref:helix-turn-helix transcriptional regulator n=1 Tax=Miniimonas arenae TaxID=676201 RepID=UPI001C582D5F|nr:transcriptional regulator [Miniimonas arenae]